MAIADDVFDRLPPQPYDSVRGGIRDGDLLLCSARDAGSRAIRWATRSPWSHIAIAFRLAEIDRVLALECVETIGVRAVPMSSFVTKTSSGEHPYPGRILLARHRAIAAQDGRLPVAAMTRFAFDRLGERFSNVETAKIGLRIALGRLGVRMPGRVRPTDEYICSEYVAECYRALGVTIPWDGLGFIAPCDFAEDPEVEAVAQIATG